jgi:hypothetical protein
MLNQKNMHNKPAKEFYFLWGLAKNIILILKRVICFGWGLEPPIANTWIRP